VHFTPTREGKGPIAAKHGVQLLVDDRLDCIQFVQAAVPGARGVLLAAPAAGEPPTHRKPRRRSKGGKHGEGAAPLPQGVVACSDWAGVLAAVLQGGGCEAGIATGVVGGCCDGVYPDPDGGDGPGGVSDVGPGGAGAGVAPDAGSHAAPDAVASWATRAAEAAPAPAPAPAQCTGVGPAPRPFYVDHHCHLNRPPLAAVAGDALARAAAAGVGVMVTIAMAVSQLPELLALCDGWPGLFASVGTHPHNADAEADVTVEDLVRLAAHPRVVALGEAGLDYYYRHSSAEAQAEGFRRHIRAARITGLPLQVRPPGCGVRRWA
jgi:hypothetical protein